jgi:site-specific DNA-methyltransferase (cytosine-N4-specific)
MNAGAAALVRGDALALPIASGTVDLVVTSPPYWGLRDYATADAKDREVGAEASPAEFIERLVAATAEMARVLRPTGSIFVNLGDKYASGGRRSYDPDDRSTGRTTRRPDDGAPSKSLLGLPWRYALRCMDDLGLILRSEIIWSKPNGMPESVTDRVARKHEQWFHFVREPSYYADLDEIREAHAPQSVARAGRNRFTEDRSQDGVGSPHSARPENACHPAGKLPGSVWEIPTQPLTPPAWVDANHYAAFPIEWPRRLILGWSPPGGRVLDPFGGTGTVAAVARALGRVGVSLDLSAAYHRIARWRTTDPELSGRVSDRTNAARQGTLL